MSMPAHLRLSLSATAMAVPQPQKRSRTTSPSLLEALMMRSSRAFEYRSRGVLRARTTTVVDICPHILCRITRVLVQINLQSLGTPFRIQ